jgi:hypothetical protein
VEKLIPCHCKVCQTQAVPGFFEHRDLLRRKEAKRWTKECDESFEPIDVLELLDGIRVDDLPRWAKEETPVASPRKIRIFLASSSELREDRDEFDRYFRQQNDRLIEKGLYLEIVLWENFRDAMSETRLQDEYNKAVRACDIFVSLFFTKTGKFTEEEFDTAHQQFQETGKPLIYTFFKKDRVEIDTLREEDLSSLRAFQKKLAEHGHFYTRYENIEHLKRQFRDQLDKMLE